MVLLEEEGCGDPRRGDVMGQEKRGTLEISMEEDQVWTTEDEVTTLQEEVYGRASFLRPFLKNMSISTAACSVCSHALLHYCQEVFS